MLIADLLFAFVFAALATGLMALLLGWRHPIREDSFAAFFFLFLLLWLGIWAGGAWITPVGPVIWGVSWLPFLFIALIILLLVAAIAPPRRKQVETRAPETSARAAGVFGLAFWILVILLMAVIIARYV